MSLRATLLASTLAAVSLFAHAEKSPEEIHKSVLVFDPHVDIYSPYDWKSGDKIVAPEKRSNQISTEQLLAGSYDALGYSVFVPQGERTQETYRLARLEADAKLDYLHELAKKHPETYTIASTAADVRAAEANGKIAIVPTILNAFPLGQSADTLNHFHKHGVRILGFTHAGHNDFADSDRPQQRDKQTEHGGLSAEGKKLVKRANELGILLDVSQITHEAFLDVLELSDKPVIASHSGIYALSPSPRSLTDEELDLIKQNGGVAGIVAFSSYLVPTSDETARKIAELGKKYGQTNGYEGLSIAQREALSAERSALQTQATVKDYVNALEYAVKRIGIDHVAISSDFNHGGGVAGWEDASGAAAVTKELVSRGYSEADIAKLWGGNVLRVLEAAQKK